MLTIKPKWHPATGNLCLLRREEVPRTTEPTHNTIELSTSNGKQMRALSTDSTILSSLLKRNRDGLNEKLRRNNRNLFKNTFTTIKHVSLTISQTFVAIQHSFFLLYKKSSQTDLELSKTLT